MHDSPKPGQFAAGVLAWSSTGGSPSQRLARTGSAGWPSPQLATTHRNAQVRPAGEEMLCCIIGSFSQSACQPGSG